MKVLVRRGHDEVPRGLYSFGDIEVDFVRAELRKDGEAIELTPIEFKLLSVFIQSRGRVLTRERLLSGAWSPETFASDRVVDNHIGNLLKKIEPDSVHPHY